MSLAQPITSSSSSHGSATSTGPNTSSRRDAPGVLDAGEHGRQVLVAGPAVVGQAADQRLRALVERLLQVAADAPVLGAGDQRADVRARRRARRRPPSRRARVPSLAVKSSKTSRCTYRREPAVQDWPWRANRIAAITCCTVASSLESGIDDRRRLAAQLERHREDPLGRRAHRDPARPRSSP